MTATRTTGEIVAGEAGSDAKSATDETGVDLMSDSYAGIPLYMYLGMVATLLLLCCFVGIMCCQRRQRKNNKKPPLEIVDSKSGGTTMGGTTTGGEAVITPSSGTFGMTMNPTFTPMTPMSEPGAAGDVPGDFRLSSLGPGTRDMIDTLPLPSTLPSPKFTVPMVEMEMQRVQHEREETDGWEEMEMENENGDFIVNMVLGVDGGEEDKGQRRRGTATQSHTETGDLDMMYDAVDTPGAVYDQEPGM